jgi:LmbE family N-acetylglucosaminyl deacetylase
MPHDPMKDFGVVHDAELTRIAVVSPHFDDAVLGCGRLLAAHPGATVITVFGGPPAAYPAQVTAWDADCGYSAGDDIVARRREEDRAALTVLDADSVWLDFPDHQYLEKADRPTPDEVVGPLADAIAATEPTAVFMPFGLGNPDHVRTHEAGRLGRERHPELAWFCYEDCGYKHIPGMLAWRVSSLFRAGLWPTPAIVPVAPDDARKRAALQGYAPQVRALERNWRLDRQLAAPVPEQFWRLAPPPPGWEGLAET